MSYGYSKSLTIDHTQVGTATSTSFPLTFNSTLAHFKTVANGGRVEDSNGYDIVFFSDASLTTPLDFEIEKYVPTTGEFVAHVRIPTLSHTVDTVIWIGYGNASIVTSQENVTAVWDTNFQAVYHLKDGTTLNVNSSTGTNNGTNHSATAAAGQVDGAATLVRASSHYISAADDSSIDFGTTAFTVSAWFKKASNGWFGGMASKINNDLAGWTLHFNSDDKPEFYIANAATFDIAGSAAAITDTNWHHAVGLRNGASVKLYIDGSEVASVTDNAKQVNNAEIFAIGPYRSVSVATNLFDGSIDETRLSNAARSPSWVTAEYNNQKPASTFYALADTTAFVAGQYFPPSF